MRDVKPALTEAWLAGDFTGARRPIARVTLQQAGITQHSTGYNVYTSLPFGRPDVRLRLVRAKVNAPLYSGGRPIPGPPNRSVTGLPIGVADGRPREMPNVLKVEWSRDADSEIASATITFANTEPLPIGVTPHPDLDQPGYFTYNRGASTYRARWGHTINEWSGLLLPDNLLRTYEGYGFDATVIPEDDPHLEQTGVWMIDKVDYNADGTITCTCRDIGRILADQIIFPPVAPKGFYPLSLTRTTVQPGFVPGKTFTKVVTRDGAHDPNHPPPDGWTGPYAPPALVGITDGDGQVVVNVKAAATPADPRYRINGYQLRVDNVLLPQVVQIPAGATVAVTVPSLTNGDVYYVQANTIYLDTLTGHAHLGDDSQGMFGRPRHAGAPHLQTGSLLLNTDADGNQNVGETHPGQLVWRYTAVGRPVVFTAIFYKSEPALPGETTGRLRRLVKQYSVGAKPAGTSQVVEAMTTADVQPLTSWNILVYGSTGAVPLPAGAVELASDGQVLTHGRLLADTAVPTATGYSVGEAVRTGAGEAFFAPTGGQFYFPPAPSAPPQQTAVINGGDKPVRLAYDTSSNDYYDGANDRSVSGHNPRDAFDGNPATYFLSVGNESPSRGFAFEWVQGACGGQTLTAVTFSTVKAGYTAYVSVFARGAWTAFSPHDVIPYNPSLPQSHNGGNIPFCETIPVPHEGPHTVRLRQPIPGATKVRVTLRNLQDFGIGPYHYRGAIRDLSAITDGSMTVSGPAVDSNDPSVVRTYVVTEPPYVQPGVGQINLSGQPATAASSSTASTARRGRATGDNHAAARTAAFGVSTPTPLPPIGETNSAYPTGIVYYDYTDVIKLFCAWGGFFWPKNASVIKTDGTTKTYAFGPGPYGLPAYVDPVLGTDAGRVWGDFEQTGTGGVADLTHDLWDKKPLLDAIVYLREIVGFLFYIDELGSVVWRHPNIYQVGNNIATLTQQPRRTSEMLTLDETRDLTSLQATLDSRNVRERIFIANTDGRTAALAKGFNPNPIGLRRVGGWTDQNFASQAECQRMADFIALRQLFTYRTDSLSIAAYPKIQVDDQVRIFERVTSETYIHYVNGIRSTNDLQTGEWTYDLNTHWLGETPGDLWVFHPTDFSVETQAYLKAIGLIDIGAPGTTVVTPTGPLKVAPPAPTPLKFGDDVAITVKLASNSDIYITNGINKRKVLNASELSALISLGLAPAVAQVVSQAVFDAMPTVAAGPQ